MLNAFMILLKGVMPLLLIYVVKFLIDKVSVSINQGNQGGSVLDVYPVLIFTGGVFIVNAFVNSLAGIFSEKHSFFITDKVQNWIHNRTSQIDILNFDDNKFQNVYYRAINEATYRPSKIYYGFIDLIQSVITIGLMMGVLFTLHWMVVIVLVVISVPIVYVRLKFSGRIYDFKRKHTEDERYIAYYNALLTAKQYAKELRVFNLSALFKQRFEHKKDDLREKRFALLKIKSAYEFSIQLLTAGALVLLFAYITKQAFLGKLTQGQVVLYLLALYRGYNYLQSFLSKLSALYEDSLFLKNLFEFLDYDVVNNKATKKYNFPRKLHQGIELKNVSFKYPDSSRFVFNHLNLRIKAGDTVALVGANGAGKSTLVKLICGLYQPDEGDVLFDDVKLSQIKQDSLVDNISVVFQDFMLYNVSARENIWFGNIEKSLKNQSVYQSAYLSGIDKTLEALPEGYDTTLGTLFKKSEMLSVGEWQRMALARSFFNDAQLVILDEPTSSLDAYTEASLVDNIKSIVANKTALIVSHRLSTIKLADRVIVVGNNGIIEQGEPELLLQKKGAFYDMVINLKDKKVI